MRVDRVGRLKLCRPWLTCDLLKRILIFGPRPPGSIYFLSKLDDHVAPVGSAKRMWFYVVFHIGFPLVSGTDAPLKAILNSVRWLRAISHRQMV
jgi:hypothetical protein